MALHAKKLPPETAPFPAPPLSRNGVSICALPRSNCFASCCAAGSPRLVPGMPRAWALSHGGSFNNPKDPPGLAGRLWVVATQPPYSLYDKVRRAVDLMRSLSPSFSGRTAHWTKMEPAGGARHRCLVLLRKPRLSRSRVGFRVSGIVLPIQLACRRGVCVLPCMNSCRRSPRSAVAARGSREGVDCERGPIACLIFELSLSSERPSGVRTRFGARHDDHRCRPPPRESEGNYILGNSGLRVSEEQKKLHMNALHVCRTSVWPTLALGPTVLPSSTQRIAQRRRVLPDPGSPTHGA